ncbi:MAG: hypothetical protein SGARI_004907, partial [Bacillariaceae sp.]
MAQFVAAVLKDKTVGELIEQVEQQQAELNELVKVEITGPGGKPVYVKGLFHEGSFLGDENGSHGWVPVSSWFVVLKEKERTECPVRNLRGVEVRLGGVVQFSLNPERDQVTTFDLQDGPGDHRIDIDVADGAMLSVVVKGWDEDRDGWNQQAVAALEVLETLPINCVVDFGALMTFSVEKYKNLIGKGLPKQLREMRKEQLRGIEDHKAIRARLSEIVPQMIPRFHHHIYELFIYHLKIPRVTAEFEL